MWRVPLTVLLWTTIFLTSPGANEDGAALRLSAVKHGYVTGTPYVAPDLELRVLAGAPKGYVYGCKQEVETRKREDHADDIVILSCADGVRLELKGVHFK